VAGRRPDQSNHRAAAVFGSPDAQGPSQHALAQTVDPTGKKFRDQFTRVDRKLEGRHQKPVFGTEVVKHQRRVDAGRCGDVADRGAVVSALRELLEGGDTNCFPVLRRAWRPAYAPTFWLRASWHPLHSKPNISTIVDIPGCRGAEFNAW
jgi:hypothetical protein